MKREAQAALRAAGITTGQDFKTLTHDQIIAVSAEAEAAYVAKHGKPVPADSASYLRKRYHLLQQRARS